jgi:hypothetical protein
VPAWGRGLGTSEVDEILDLAKDQRRRCSADAVARFLGVTYAQRQRLKLTTIGAIDVNKRSRDLLRKRSRRRYLERRRRAEGAETRAAYEGNSLMHTKPWEAEGISRRTWYRRKHGTSPKPAIPTLKDDVTNGTSPKPALFLTPGFAPVPPERKKGGSRGGAKPSAKASATQDRECSGHSGGVVDATVAGCSWTNAKAERVERNRRETADPGEGWLRSRFTGKPWPVIIYAGGRLSHYHATLVAINSPIAKT